MKGYKKITADKKQREIMKPVEGKSPLSFPGYIRISSFFTSLTASAKYSWQLIMFGWLFLVICWNLIGRSNSEGYIMLQHIDWSQDCLRIKLVKHKGDQTGEAIGSDKHDYANPFNPSICPILVLAIYIYCKYRGSDAVKQQLFDGNDSESRFGKVLVKVLKLIKETCPDVDLGAIIEDLGTHSNRKGALSYLLSMFLLMLT